MKYNGLLKCTVRCNVFTRHFAPFPLAGHFVQREFTPSPDLWKFRRTCPARPADLTYSEMSIFFSRRAWFHRVGGPRHQTIYWELPDCLRMLNVITVKLQLFNAPLPRSWSIFCLMQIGNVWVILNVTHVSQVKSIPSLKYLPVKLWVISSPFPTQVSDTVGLDLHFNDVICPMLSAEWKKECYYMYMYSSLRPERTYMYS